MLENGTSVGRYCGSSQPPVITSSSNTLEISFTSDGNINGRGFIAYYTLTGKTAVTQILINIETNIIYDGVEAETRKSQARFQIIWSYARLAEHKT